MIPGILSSLIFIVTLYWFFPRSWIVPLLPLPVLFLMVGLVWFLVFIPKNKLLPRLTSIRWIAFRYDDYCLHSWTDRFLSIPGDPGRKTLQRKTGFVGSTSVTITTVVSMFLDNVTTIVLIAPVTILICESLGWIRSLTYGRSNTFWYRWCCNIDWWSPNILIGSPQAIFCWFSYP